MPYSELANPYDFANPVTKQTLLVGRSKELDEIKYYLNHAKTAPRPINLAVLGDRASGKTSILNITEIEARNRGFCVARVDLDEGDSHSELAFFLKIFDTTLTEVCSLGGYGGLSGRTYLTYRDMVDAYLVPDDLTFCPFVFPLQYAKAMSANNPHAQLSDTIFKRDLAAIRDETQKPVVIVFDECDVLAQSRVHLEKLRNIFMNTPGYLLVMTGTPALFPLMDDVFSPIVRQFKKISIGPFGETRDTETCIKRPLQDVGEFDLTALFDFDNVDQLEEIHDLTGGRPYEIQLLCHVLFRRVQEGRDSKMVLTLDVLDDLLKELETGQDLTNRPTLNVIRNLEPEALAALRVQGNRVLFTF